MFTSNQERLTIDTTGRVGIGSNAPTSMLQLVGVATVDLMNVISSSGSSLFTILQGGNVGIGTSTPTGLLTVASSSGSSLFSVLANGNVGIGTSTPGSSLSVVGGAGDTDNLFTVASSSGTQFFNIDYTGNIGIGSSTPSARLSITPSAGQMAFLVASSSGATAFAINSAGYVSIGTASPVSGTTTVPLRVAGDIRVGSSGTNGCLQGNGGATLIGTCISDQNLKTNIVDISNLLDRFQSLRVINFNWNTLANATYGNDMDATNTGYLAQNIEALFPELVITDAQGFKQVNYSAMSLYTAEAVKELSVVASSSSSTLAALGLVVLNNYNESSSTLAALQSQLSSITTKLDIANAATGSLSIITVGSSTNTVAIGIGTTTPTYTFTIVSRDDINPFSVASSSGLSYLTISSSGDVAIGTSTAGARLDIYKDTSSSDVDVLRIISDVDSVGNVKIIVDLHGRIYI
jgi:hypothetical protein